MTLNNIDYLLKIIETGSLIKAAEELHISQPSLSQLIKTIERHYHLELFVRHSKPLRLTYAGEHFIDAISHINAIERNLKRTLENINNEKKGRINLGIPMFRAIAFLPELLAVYRKQYPDVEVYIQEAGSVTLEKQLEDGKIDIAFASIGNYVPSVHYVKIFAEQIYVIAGKNTALAQRIPSGSAIDITETEQESFIYVKRGHGVRGIQDALFARHKMNPHVFFETSSIELAKKLAEVCDKVTLYPELVHTKFHIEKDGAFYTIKDAQNMRSFCLCYRKDFPLTQYMRDFIQCAADILDHKRL